MRRIEIGRAGIAFREAGRRGALVVLLHGSAASSGQWRALAERLEGRFRVLAPDLHGHGRSDPWPGPAPLTLADDAAIVAALADREGEPVHLVGHSYGAAVALQFAQRHPHRLRSLALIEPVAFHLLREAGPACGAMLTKVEGVAGAVARVAAWRDTASAMARFVDFWNGDGAWSRMPADRRVAVERQAGAVAANFVAALGDTAPLSSHRRIEVPTLVACGTETPAPMRHIAEALIRTFPRIQALRVADAGHMLPITHPAAINDAVAAHLDRATTAGLVIRPLDRSDLPEVERHLLALGPTDRRARFGTALNDAAIAAYARGIDPARALLIGAFDGPGGRIVGLAEAQPTGAPRRVEMAVSVQAQDRRRGLGRMLVARAAAGAFARGAEAAEFLFAPDNRPVAGLIRALGARIAATLDWAELRPALPGALREAA